MTADCLPMDSEVTVEVVDHLDVHGGRPSRLWVDPQVALSGQHVGVTTVSQQESA